MLETVPELEKLTPFKVSALPPTANAPLPLMVKFVEAIVTLLVKVTVEPLKMVVVVLVNEPLPDKFCVVPLN